MIDSVYRRDNCRLCGSRSLELVLPFKPTPLADSYVDPNHLSEADPVYPLDLYLCGDCGFVQLLDVVDPQLIFRNYIYETSSSLGLARYFEEYAGEIYKIVQPPTRALVVDVGSNDGALLRCYQKYGLRVLGFDPCLRIAKEATASGIQTTPAFLSQSLSNRIKNEFGPAAIITATHLVNAVDDLAESACAIRDLLAPDGIFVFESFYLMDWMQNMVFDFTYHEHLSYFSVKPLVSFFRRHNMELIDVKRVPTKGGSVRYTIQRAGGPRPVSPAVADLIALETKTGLDNPKTFKVFAARIDNAKKKVLDLVKSLLEQGKTIAGYGASATTTTLIYHFELGDKLRFIADDYEAKQNLYSPGYHIPVLAPQALYERKPDYVLILAWRYAEPIIKKHKAFLEQGGKFIVPLPDLRVV